MLITWLKDANYATTELNDTRKDHIIAEIGSIGGHILSKSDFGKWVSGEYYNGLMTWWGAKAWAEALTYEGISDWRLPDSRIPIPAALISYPRTTHPYNSWSWSGCSWF